MLFRSCQRQVRPDQTAGTAYNPARRCGCRTVSEPKCCSRCTRSTGSQRYSNPPQPSHLSYRIHQICTDLGESADQWSIQAAPENRVAALVGLERRVIAGNVVSSVLPRIRHFIWGIKGQKSNISGQVRVRMLSFMLTEDFL